MDRLWTKALVFCGLLGAAGLLFGVPESYVFLSTRLILPEAEQSVPWFVPVCFPLSFALVIFSVWLAGRWATGSAWLGLRAVGAAHYPLIYAAIWIGIAFGAALGELDAGFGTMFGLLGILLSLCLIDMVRTQRLAKQKTPEQKAESRRLVRPILTVGIPLLLLVGAIGYLVERDAGRRSWELYGFSSMGGFSLPMAAQLGGLGLVDFARWLRYALCIGGALGVFTGVMLASGSDGDIRGRMLRRSAIGAVLGAVCSGLMFGAHSVLLLQTYRVAWNSYEVLVASLWIWCITGLLGGLMLTGAVHVMSTPPENRLDRIRRIVPLIALPMVLFALWAHGFVRHYDAGRQLLVEASRLEGQCWWIKIDVPPGDKVTHPGNSVLHIHSDGRLTRDAQDGRYDQTISLCDRLIREYPDSAFYSGAIYLKYLAQSRNWQPGDAIATGRTLDQKYPRHGYMLRGMGLVGSSYVLVGDYEQVLSLYREENPSLNARYRGGRPEYRAACILGRWDDAIGMCRTAMAGIERDIADKVGNPASLRPWQKRLAYTESMKARGAGPTPRIDVRGRVLCDGKPMAGVRVCLLPVEERRDQKPITTPDGAAHLGGVLGVTDECGVYRIRGVPVGDYEVLIVASPGRLSAGTKAGGPDLPIIVRSRGAELKDIKLTSPPQ